MFIKLRNKNCPPTVARGTTLAIATDPITVPISEADFSSEAEGSYTEISNDKKLNLL